MLKTSQMSMSEKPEPSQASTDPCIIPLSTNAIVCEAKIEVGEESHVSVGQSDVEPSYPAKVQSAVIFGALTLTTLVIGFVTQPST
jgi:hypothetical protein